MSSRRSVSTPVSRPPEKQVEKPLRKSDIIKPSTASKTLHNNLPKTELIDIYQNKPKSRENVNNSIPLRPSSPINIKNTPPTTYKKPLVVKRYENDFIPNSLADNTKISVNSNVSNILSITQPSSSSSTTTSNLLRGKKRSFLLNCYNVFFIIL